MGHYQGWGVLPVAVRSHTNVSCSHVREQAQPSTVKCQKLAGTLKGYAGELCHFQRFDYYDPQWAKVDAGGFFNVSYIVESFLLPISFFMHIACYIQRQNGK